MEPRQFATGIQQRREKALPGGLGAHPVKQ
jgi:hypothetical protein